MKKSSAAATLVSAARELARAADGIAFAPPVHTVYNPLRYAWRPHRLYLETFGRPPKRVLFLGMNPGPWGMAQTGVPFGEVAAVRDWLGISSAVGRPPRPHPRRPVLGFACRRSEVSGRRLWGFFRSRYPDAAAFFADHFVANYCPLLFLDSGGGNLTPDKLKAGESGPLFFACDRHLRRLAEIIEPRWVVGVGRFAEAAARRALSGLAVEVGCIPHPSPASPLANRDWAGSAAAALKSLGIGFPT